MIKTIETIHIKRYAFGVTLDVGCKVIALNWGQVEKLIGIFEMMKEGPPIDPDFSTEVTTSG